MLKARPERIEAAVATLGPSRGDVTQSKVKLEQFRNHLLKIPMDELGGFRAAKRALGVLPHFASDRDAEVVERVLAISISSVKRLRWRTIAGLLPYFYSDDAFREVVNKRARKDSPPRKAPRWLYAHHQAILARSHPVSRLAQAMAIDEAAIAKTLQKAGLRAGTPLSEAVLLDLIERGDDRWLASQPYTLTLRWIEKSPASWRARRLLLERILEAGTRAVGTLKTLSPDAAIVEVLALAARKLHGWPHQSREWRTMPASAVRIATWCVDNGVVPS